MRRAAGLLALTAGAVSAGAARAQEAAPPAPARPATLSNRWQEDWSVLADRRVPREALDALRYIPLTATAPSTYLSLGANQRVRYEVNDAPAFGIGRRADGYVIGRTEFHADLRAGPVQAFAQLQSAWTIGKVEIGPPDRNRLDLEQGFLAIVLPVGRHVFKARVGRQQFAFDKQRFVSIRNGPNVRQSFDAIWADYETGTWRVIGYLTRPVRTLDRRAFDDRSDRHLTFSGLRVERKVLGDNELSAYWSRYTETGTRFGTVTGDERRDVLDLRFAGTRRGWDWDTEAMVQRGRFAGRRIRAWYAGGVVGRTVGNAPLSPRIGLQVDVAAGDRDPSDRDLTTFNPLFPSGTYLTLAGETGLSNLLHVKPSLTVHPTRRLTALLAAAAQWRLTTADAVYVQPSLPVRGTAGRPGRWTGAYGQLRADWKASDRVAVAIEAVRFAVGDAIRAAGGRHTNYLGLEVAFGL